MAFSGHLRSAVGLITVALLSLALVTVVGVAPAVADPAPPPNASEAAKRLAVAQREAEELTEQWHAARDQVEVKQGEARRARDAVEPARKAAARARANEEAFRTSVDVVATQAYEGGQLDQLNALILSDSPSDFLDQMTTLDSYTADRLAVLNEMVELVSASTRAQADADGAAARARQAVEEARASYNEIAVRKKAAEVRINEAEKLLARLDPRERNERTRDEGGPVGVVLGTGKGALALKAAMTQMRKPYAWGADGPSSFDCSGLMYWAFKKVGITLPRSSSAQSKVGRPVDKSDLQPGDLVFFYSPVSHVGFYAGNGKVLNAVQTGDVVRYSDLSRMEYHSARRL